MKFLIGYLVGCGLALNMFLVLSLLGYSTVIETPLWWIDFLRSLGFVVELIR
jgi:hypothetical protein